MPKNCERCSLFGWCESRNTYCMDENNENFIRPSDCPLHELPPHGRLIDADALNDMINRSYPMTDRVDVHNGYGICQEMIKQLPTIIEADDSIKRAEWEKHNDGIMYWWECSKCHHDAWYDGDDLHNYCPWCGAKMTIIEAEVEDG